LLDKEQMISDFIWFVLALTKRYTFRAFLLYRGNCSEPIIKEAFVPWGRSGEETCKNAGWKL